MALAQACLSARLPAASCRVPRCARQGHSARLLHRTAPACVELGPTQDGVPRMTRQASTRRPCHSDRYLSEAPPSRTLRGFAENARGLGVKPRHLQSDTHLSSPPGSAPPGAAQGRLLLGGVRFVLAVLSLPTTSVRPRYQTLGISTNGLAPGTPTPDDTMCPGSAAGALISALIARGLRDSSLSSPACLTHLLFCHLMLTSFFNASVLTCACQHGRISWSPNTPATPPHTSHDALTTLHLQSRRDDPPWPVVHALARPRPIGGSIGPRVARPTIKEDESESHVLSRQSHQGSTDSCGARHVCPEPGRASLRHSNQTAH